MSLPRDWAMLGERLARWSPAIGDAEAATARRLSYVRHGLVPERGGAPGGGVAGRLDLDIVPAGGGLRLRARETVIAGFTTMESSAEIEADANDLVTPRSWTLAIRWTSKPPAGGRTGEMDQSFSGRSRNGVLAWSAPAPRQCPAPARWTCGWSLFAAAARWPRQPGGAVEFDLLDEMDLWKPSQRLAFAGQTVVPAAGRAWRLDVFEQRGRGVMPWRWWVAEGGLVILAAGDRRAYLLESAGPGGVP